MVQRSFAGNLLRAAVLRGPERDARLGQACGRLLYPCNPEVGDIGSACIIICLLYTSDAADDLLCVDLGGRRIIKKKKQIKKES